MPVVRGPFSALPVSLGILACFNQVLKANMLYSTEYVPALECNPHKDRIPGSERGHGT